MRLTDDVVRALECPPGRKDRLVFADAPTGFAVRIQATGDRSFLFGYTVAGAKRRIPLGAFGEVTTAAARKEAERLRGEVRAGRDPWAERKAAAVATVTAEKKARAEREEAAFTVGAMIDLYAEKHVATLRPATQRDVLSRLRLHLAPIAEKPAAAIGRREVAKVIDAAAKAGDTTARRVRDYARAMWGWAQRRGTLPETVRNPWEMADAPGRDVPRERTLDAAEVGAVWRAAGTLPPPYGPLVRLALLTLARREEVTAMTWGEVAPDLATWTQPAGRTKNGRAHVVHLAEPARALLREMRGTAAPKPDALVFGTLAGKAVTAHSWAKRGLDRAIGAEREKAGLVEPMPAWTLHDFRRSGVTWLANAGFPPHVADKLLNHVQGTIKGVAAIYQRGEFLAERERALEAWAAHVAAAASALPARANVTPLAEHRQRRRA